MWQWVISQGLLFASLVPLSFWRWPSFRVASNPLQWARSSIDWSTDLMFSTLGWVLFSFVTSSIWCGSLGWVWSNGTWHSSYIRWGHSLCKYASRVKGHTCCFQDLISMFCAETFLFASCIPAPPKLSTLTYIFQFDSHEGFQKAFKPKFIQVSKGPFGALIGFIPHF